MGHMPGKRTRPGDGDYSTNHYYFYYYSPYYYYNSYYCHSFDISEDQNTTILAHHGSHPIPFPPPLTV